jgi:hypothetical protein
VTNVTDCSASAPAAPTCRYGCVRQYSPRSRTLTTSQTALSAPSFRLPFVSRQTSRSSPTTLPAQYARTTQPAPPVLPVWSSSDHAVAVAMAAVPAMILTSDSGREEVARRDEGRGCRTGIGYVARCSGVGGACILKRSKKVASTAQTAARACEGVTRKRRRDGDG